MYNVQVHGSSISGNQCFVCFFSILICFVLLYDVTASGPTVGLGLGDATGRAYAGPGRPALSRLTRRAEQ